jgi:hypothetical protein
MFMVDTVGDEVLFEPVLGKNQAGEDRLLLGGEHLLLRVHQPS